MRRLCFPVCLLFCCACGNNRSANPPAPGQPMRPVGRDSIPTAELRRGRAAAATDTLRFETASDRLSVQGVFTATQRDSLFHFEATRPGRLEARLIPGDRNFNIRINQILLPGGGADGPFGRQLSYALKQKGWYALRIGPDRMAEGDTLGRFRLLLRIH